VWRSLGLGLAVGLLAVPAAAAKDPWDPKTKIRVADQSAAARVLVTQDDLGSGWSGGARKPTSFKAPTCPAQRPNDGDLTITGHAESLFSNGNGGIQIDTDVEVLATEKQAKARFTRFLQPKLFTCLEYDLAKSVGGTGVTFLKTSRLDIAKVADRTAAFRVPIAVKVSGKNVVVDSDYLFLGVGRSQVYVNVIAPSVQEAQLPAFELRLAKLLVKRMRA